MLLQKMALKQISRVLVNAMREAARESLGVWKQQMRGEASGVKAHFFDDWIQHVSMWEEKWRHVDVANRPQGATLDRDLCLAMENVGVATMEVERALRLRDAEEGVPEEQFSPGLLAAASMAQHAAREAAAGAQGMHVRASMVSEEPRPHCSPCPDARFASSSPHHDLWAGSRPSLGVPHGVPPPLRAV